MSKNRGQASVAEYCLYQCGDKSIAVDKAHPLGSGAKGCVYPAFEILPNGDYDPAKPLAVKVFSDRKKLQNKELEAETVKKLYSETAFYPQATEEGQKDSASTPMMIMPLLPGQPIANVKGELHPGLKDLSLSERLKVAAQVAQTYFEFYSKHLQHSDVKSENILLDLKCDAQGKIVVDCHIIDFGDTSDCSWKTISPGDEDWRSEKGAVYSLSSVLAQILGETDVFQHKIKSGIGDANRSAQPFCFENMEKNLEARQTILLASLTVRENRFLDESTQQAIRVIQKMGSQNSVERPEFLEVGQKLASAALTCEAVEQASELRVSSQKNRVPNKRAQSAFFNFINQSPVVQGMRNAILRSENQEPQAFTSQKSCPF